MNSTSIKIPSELFALAESSRFEGSFDIGELASGPDTYRFAEPVAWDVEVTNTGSALLVAGRAVGTGVCACSRCLEDVTHEFEGDIEGYFLTSGEGAPDEGKDDDIGADEFDVLPEDHIIDLEPLLRAALLVDAPDVPLCREDCRGLCPQCGANLNEGDCGCGQDEGLADFARESNPFSVLARYQFE